MTETILTAINHVRQHKKLPPLATIAAHTRLREDCGLDSMDLAEFTVVLEARTKIDVFADGPVRTVDEVLAKLKR